MFEFLFSGYECYDSVTGMLYGTGLVSLPLVLLLVTISKYLRSTSQ